MRLLADACWNKFFSFNKINSSSANRNFDKQSLNKNRWEHFVEMAFVLFALPWSDSVSEPVVEERVFYCFNEWFVPNKIWDIIFSMRLLADACWNKFFSFNKINSSSANRNFDKQSLNKNRWEHFVEMAFVLFALLWSDSVSEPVDLLNQLLHVHGFCSNMQKVF